LKVLDRNESLGKENVMLFHMVIK